MRKFESIVPGVALLKTPFNDGSYDTGVTLVQCGGKNVLIDSGEYAEVIDQLIVPALHEFGVDHLDWLLCTHNHGDHSGGHKRLLEVFGCPVAVFRGEENGFPTPVDRLLSDGEEVVPGLKILSTPGHTPYAVSYLHEASQTLITGDSFQASATDGVGLVLVTDIEAYQQSIARVVALNAQRIVAGHGFAPCDFVIEGTMRIRAFMQCCLDTIARYERFVELHSELDDSSLAALLVESEGRTLEKYITRGDGIVSVCRKK